MSWDDTRWLAFCSLIEEAWPGKFDKTTRDSWRLLLDRVEPEAAIEALRRMMLEGRRFRPAVSELLAAIRADPGKPTFEEAYTLIFGRGGALRAEARGVFDDLQAERVARNAAIHDRACSMHPLVASFIHRQGVDRLLNLPVEDEEWGEQRRRELREAWDRHVEAFDGREVAALASGRPEQLRQLDPLAALGIHKPAEITAGDAA